MTGASGREQLSFRVEGRLARLLGLKTGDVEAVPVGPDALPSLRCLLPGPVGADVSFVLRVHSRAGIPLASAAIALKAGARSFDAAPLTILAMEGYAHLNPAERHEVEARVWSRRAFATGTLD